MKKAITFIAIAGLSMGRLVIPPGCKPGSKNPECKPIAPWEWKYTSTMYPKAVTADDEDNELFQPASKFRPSKNFKGDIRGKYFDDNNNEDELFDTNFFGPRDYPKHPPRPGVLYARHQPTVLKHDKTTEKSKTTPVLKQKALDQLKTLIADDVDDEFIFRKPGKPGKPVRGGLGSRVALDEEDEEFFVEIDNELFSVKNAGHAIKNGASKVGHVAAHVLGSGTVQNVKRGVQIASDIKHGNWKDVVKGPKAWKDNRMDDVEEEEEEFLMEIDNELFTSKNPYRYIKQNVSKPNHIAKDNVKPTYEIKKGPHEWDCILRVRPDPKVTREAHFADEELFLDSLFADDEYKLKELPKGPTTLNPSGKGLDKSREFLRKKGSNYQAVI